MKAKKLFHVDVWLRDEEDWQRSVAVYKTEKTANKHADLYVRMAGIKSVRVRETEREDDDT